MDINKNTIADRRTNVDQVDTAPFSGRPANGIMLEGADTAFNSMHAFFRNMEAVDYVGGFRISVPIAIGIEFFMNTD